MKRRIYMDTAASTPVDKQVWRQMKPWLKDYCGNPSSIHTEGVVARKIVETSRQQIAEVLGSTSREIIFTSGGTEANNLAILGLAVAYVKRTGSTGHIIVSAIEHHSVLDPIRHLGQQGWQVDILYPKSDGLIDPLQVKDLLRPETVLVSVGYVNNEIGVIQPIHEIAKVLRRHRKGSSAHQVVFHTDACQAPRFLDINPLKLGVDLLTVNGSKIYGPKGIGFLYCHQSIDLDPIVFGGGQERGLRSGTENVAGIVGLMVALKICSLNRDRESNKLSKIRDQFIKAISNQISQVQINGSLESRIANNINISIDQVDAEQLVIELDSRGIACSTGSACSAGSQNDSHVLVALSGQSGAAKRAIRFTLGRDSNMRDIRYVVKHLGQLVAKLRSANDLAQNF